MTRSETLLAYHLQEALALAQAGSHRKVKLRSKPRSVGEAVHKALDLCWVADRAELEPVRTVHHLSCTGGTLIAKCIASMANVLVLNEIDLHSALPQNNSNQVPFTPTDVISLLRQGDSATAPDLVTSLFVQNIRLLRDEQWKSGKHLILRDHSHSHFLSGGQVADYPTLGAIVGEHFPTHSLVTVRDPIDSYLSMRRQGWHKFFNPSTFEEYCRRYEAFLEAYEGVPIIKYEDFTARPKQNMRRICRILKLTYFQAFEEVFSAFRFSGDSGRGGRKIIQHPPREIEEAALREIEASVTYHSLIQRLGYESRL